MPTARIEDYADIPHEHILKVCSGTSAGIANVRRHARRCGMTLAAYVARRTGGEKFCFRCGQWLVTAQDFNHSSGTPDGYCEQCRVCKKEQNIVSMAKHAHRARKATNLKRFETVAPVDPDDLRRVSEYCNPRPVGQHVVIGSFRIVRRAG